MKTICYVSNFNSNLSKQEISKLVQHICCRNTVLNITGALIIRNKQFFQIIEGTDKAVDEIYRKIETDNRHKGLIKLLDIAVEDRIFSDFNIRGYEVYERSDKLDALLQYFEWIKEANYIPAEKIISLTTQFISQKT